MVFPELGCEVEHADPGLPDPAHILDVIWSGSLAGISSADGSSESAIFSIRGY